MRGKIKTLNKEKIDRLFNSNLRKCSVCGRIIKKGKKYWELPLVGGYFCSKVCIANRSIKHFDLEEKVQEK